MIRMNRKAKFIAALSAIITISATTYAQKGAYEITAAAGASINSAPSGSFPYKGNQIAPNFTAVLNGKYNFHRSMSAGIEVRTNTLSNKSDVLYTAGGFNSFVGGDNKRFVFAKNIMSFTALFNGKLNTYRGYLYAGPALGYGMLVQDATNWKSEKESFRTPDNGGGLVWGVQAGYTHGLTAVLGLNIEAALRNYSVAFNNAPGFVTTTFYPANTQYNITAYTVTVGLKVRIMPKYKPQNDIPAMRGNGRSRR